MLRWMRGTVFIDDLRSLADGLEEEVQTGAALWEDAELIGWNQPAGVE